MEPIQLRMNEWTDVDVTPERQLVVMPTGIFGATWIQAHERGGAVKPLRIDLTANVADAGTEFDRIYTPHEVQIRRGEFVISAEKPTKLRIRVTTRQQGV